MVQITSFVMIAFLWVFGQCDLIGFNRLGNNVHSHRLHAPGMAKGNFQFQLVRWILKSDDLSAAEKKMWLQKLRHNARERQATGLPARPNNRLRKYLSSIRSSLLASHSYGRQLIKLNIQNNRKQALLIIQKTYIYIYFKKTKSLLLYEAK